MLSSIDIKPYEGKPAVNNRANEEQKQIYRELLKKSQLFNASSLQTIRNAGGVYEAFLEPNARSEEAAAKNFLQILGIMKDLAKKYKDSPEKSIRENAAVVFFWVLLQVGFADTYSFSEQKEPTSLFDVGTLDENFPQISLTNLVSFIFNNLSKEAYKDRALLLKNFKLTESKSETGKFVIVSWPKTEENEEKKEQKERKEEKEEKKENKVENQRGQRENEGSQQGQNGDEEKQDENKTERKKENKNKKIKKTKNLLLTPGVLNTYLRKFLLPEYFESKISTIELKDLRMQRNAIVALAEGLQSEALKLFENAYLGTIHRKRVTLNIKDCDLANRLADRKTRFHLSQKEKNKSRAKRKALRAAGNRNGNVRHRRPAYVVKVIQPGKFRKLVRRSGVKRMNSQISDWFEFWAQPWLTIILSRALIYMESRRKKTISTSDVIYSMKHEGIILYTFDTFDAFPSNKWK